MSDLMSQSYHDVMEVYKRPMSVRYIPAFLWGFICIVSLSLAFPQITQAYEIIRGLVGSEMCIRDRKYIKDQ